MYPYMGEISVKREWTKREQKNTTYRCQLKSSLKIAPYRCTRVKMHMFIFMFIINLDH
jgi:hypothetical protein